jgi:hypothetical protein
LSKYDTAWAEVKNWIENAKNPVMILAGDRVQGEKIFNRMSVTPKSLIGTLILETGGIFIDHGWLRFLGSGHQKMPKDMLSWNSFENGLGLKEAFVVAHDVIGGFFAINGGAFSGESNEIFYWQPHTLKWIGMEGSYSQLFSWALTGDLDRFYKNMRWPGWQSDVAQLNGDQGFSILPFLWAKADMPIAERSRRAVPMTELWYLGQDLGQRLRDVSPGTPIQLHFTETEHG